MRLLDISLCVLQNIHLCSMEHVGGQGMLWLMYVKDYGEEMHECTRLNEGRVCMRVSLRDLGYIIG